MSALIPLNPLVFSFRKCLTINHCINYYNYLNINGKVGIFSTYKRFRLKDKRLKVLEELRLDSARTAKVIAEIGIDPDVDLRRLTFQDFIRDGLTHEIVKMRYENYVQEVTGITTILSFYCLL